METDILIISHFIRGNLKGRFEYLANEAVNKGNTVEVVTSDFSHDFKKKRKIRDFNNKGFKFKLTMIEEPGYIKNISLKRFYSHMIFAKNLKKYLVDRPVPDIVYCSVPSLDSAKVAAKYAKENNIKFILDVQDLWPEAFKMAFDIPILTDFLYYPLKKRAKNIYSDADKIVAVSQTYAEIAAACNNKATSVQSVYLGTDLKEFDESAKLNKIIDKSISEFWVTYIGTLGHSYDLPSVISAIEVLQKKGIKNIKFLVIGDGPLKKEFEIQAKQKGIFVEFTGYMEYEKMTGFLKASDVAVNPIIETSSSSIINKVGDYAAASLPVINTQNNNEYRDLLIEYKAGLNCSTHQSEELAEKILQLYKNKDLRKQMGENNRKLAEEKFDRRTTYQNLILEIMEL